MKAESDLFLATTAMQSRSKLVPEGVCFPSQQCVEKYLKARLVEAGVTTPKTHDLADLLARVAPFEPLWLPWAGMLHALSYYAAQFRYPGNNADRADARQALQQCRSIRREIRLSLGLTAK